MMSPWKKVLILLAVMLGMILQGCQTDDPPLVPTTDEVNRTPQTSTEVSNPLSLKISGVEVREGEKIIFSGTTSVSTEHCLYSQLYQNGNPVEWWPAGKCFPIDGEDWVIQVPLGTEGVPEALDADAQYFIKVWWAGAPQSTEDIFYFDLASPPAP